MDLYEFYRIQGYLNGLKVKSKVKFEDLKEVQNMLALALTKIKKDNLVEEDLREVGFIDDFTNDEICIYENPAHDPSENPWIDVLGDNDEAYDAYWNTE